MQLASRVVSCVPAEEEAADPNGVKAAYDVVLEDTVLFPEGGGQVRSFLFHLCVHVQVQHC